jgi:ribonucleoside-diphosphate reductase beta chain
VEELHVRELRDELAIAVARAKSAEAKTNELRDEIESVRTQRTATNETLEATRHDLDRAREEVSDAFRHIFDVALVRAHEELVAAPADLAAKVRFVTLYHQVLEGTLGLTSFKFITDYLNNNNMLSGFVEGYSKIHHDETRHIGYGVWFLRETVRAHPEQADVVRETLRDLLPAVADSLKLPGDGGASAVLGVSEEDLRQFALGGLTRRLAIIGVPIETVFA